MQESSLSHYMHLSQREASADVVNAAILMASSSEKRKAQAPESRSVPPQAGLAHRLDWLSVPCRPGKLAIMRPFSI